jgi:centrosomal protein CEP164|uniref:WW domain-containing protein n=1 Tax=Eutreptiella gymnastica TaxID=73025 RepID=A0A7S4GHD2_9EUGL|mmetsp:Transcript_74489/g.125496  ORF Transcript_74489/g.125496 Transcript_74489/m.125496 type:complete len:429 (+) Transcript_74489:56-1342(+)|eukprot:CAMPEP_0174287886 /NCGR_PEP_ID=MMETSP0809-20121228/18157_1 /TAXON_ID=73025 ORGANISM="Eutreptiella gymnastica-like, Strain CCMP1594" /NCGR_SAMPLE_ID=MMETSP0809 /ASSEMBLY_ACC=CAM_ASM_000658 /LENGTH=428 /DNA_ID=CAMNT_0015384715 /DNA_START=56 /DNA_END=1342 /DNA_ORIENTATION=-
MSEQPIALKELYSDVSQLRALYSDSTANSKAAWGDNKPAVPTSARNAVSDASPLSARLMNKKPESGPQSARAPKTNAYSFCLQLPATARAQLSQGHIPEVPLPAPVKSARQPDSARPLATPRGSKAQPAEVADASPVKVQVGATDGSGAPYIPPAGTVFEYDGGSSVVLSPHTDPPSEKEVQDYGQWLGLDLNTEKDLMWLAKEALMAPLPPYWRPCNTQDGEVYYFNFATGESIWDHPMDSLFKRFVPLERSRLQKCRDSGNPYEVTQAYIHATIGAFLAHLCPPELQQSLMREQNQDQAAAYIPQPGTVFEYEGGGYSAVLDDNADNYQPTDQEIADYARWLGISMDDEEDLLWIAKDGLTTPLPDPWRPCKTNTGDLYYFNFGTGESAWEHPMDEFFKKLVILERDKLQKCKQEGKTYTRGVPAS